MRQCPSVAAAVVGNSRLLATYSARGELEALYWPHIDYGQHVHEMLCGLEVAGAISWLHDDAWQQSQEYVADTAILLTRSGSERLGLAVEAADFAPAGADTLVRRFTVRNVGNVAQPVRFAFYAHMRLEESPQYNTVLHAPALQGLIFYRREVYLAVSADRPCASWQAGRIGRPSDARPQVDAGLQGRPIDCGDVNGAVVYDLGSIAPGGTASVTLYMTLGSSMAGVTDEANRFQAESAAHWQAEAAQWWQQWLAGGHAIATGSERLDALYRRSLITLKQLADERGGGFIAGPEVDPQNQLSGGYAYCWGRDAAYMTTAMDEAGFHDETAAFFLRWAARAQEPSGALLHRHYVDGTLAPSWGMLQIDEGASILFGAWRHFELTGNREFVRAFWPAIVRGADYLISYRDEATGLPGHSIDLWEKRDAIHSYSSSAVYAGLVGAARMAEAIGEDGARYAAEAEVIKAAISEHLWSAAEGRFIRTKGLIATGPAEPGRKDLAQADMADISLLGVTFPFGVFPADDERVRSTAAVLEAALAVPGTGAVYRYPGDQYIGGHPWLICSLWLAIYKLAVGEEERARELIAWTADRATPLGLLPEQVNLQTGAPTWVTPLAWSHALFVLALRRFGR
ncbi:MAG: glycoside hydrolase family 15 protein [Mycobacterium leprae]